MDANDDNAWSVEMPGEGHTLGGVLCAALDKCPHVTFAAYAIREPRTLEIKIRADFPARRLGEAAQQCRADVAELRREFVASYGS